MGKIVGIAEFKATCERLIVQMEQDGEPIQLTRRGKVVGVLSPPAPAEPAKPFPSAFGLLKSDKYRFDMEPEEMVDPDWEAGFDAKWDRKLADGGSVP